MVPRHLGCDISETQQGLFRVSDLSMRSGDDLRADTAKADAKTQNKAAS